MDSQNCVRLSDGHLMPVVGFGTWQATESELDEALENALNAGYRHIDTAYVYDNEAVIGKVLKRWFDSGKLKREDIFITTKLPPRGNRPESVRKYLDISLKSLQLSYVDLYLIHAPFGLHDENPFDKDSEGNLIFDPNTDHLATWKEMEAQVTAGKAKSIGISNFNIKQTERILKGCSIKPANLQVEIHLYLQQNDLVDFCLKNNISVTAYSPLGSRGIIKVYERNNIEKEIPDLMANPSVLKIAEKYNKTPAQVLLKQTIQRGLIVIPKSTNFDRLRQNINVFDFCLTKEDMEELAALDKGSAVRICDMSMFKGIEKHPEFPW